MASHSALAFVPYSSPKLITCMLHHRIRSCLNPLRAMSGPKMCTLLSPRSPPQTYNIKRHTCIYTLTNEPNYALYKSVQVHMHVYAPPSSLVVEAFASPRNQQKWSTPCPIHWNPFVRCSKGRVRLNQPRT